MKSTKSKKTVELAHVEFVKSDLFNNYHLSYMQARLAEASSERLRETPN